MKRKNSTIPRVVLDDSEPRFFFSNDMSIHYLLRSSWSRRMKESSLTVQRIYFPKLLLSMVCPQPNGPFDGESPTPKETKEPCEIRSIRREHLLSSQPYYILLPPWLDPTWILQHSTQSSPCVHCHRSWLPIGDAKMECSRVRFVHSCHESRLYMEVACLRSSSSDFRSKPSNCECKVDW